MSIADLHIFSLRRDGLATAAQISDHGVDAVVLMNLENDDYLREFTTWRIPGVVVDYCTAGIPLDSVACDNAAGAERTVRHLVELGHRHIQYVSVDPNLIETLSAGTVFTMRSSDFAERREAATRALAASAGVRWGETVVPRGAQGVIIPECARRWRQDSDRPTAFLADSDVTAESLIRHLADQGVAVPGDVSVCTVAMAGPVTVGSLALTGARFDFVGMGRKAVELLKQRCENPETAPAPAVYRVGFSWEEDGTCRGVTC